MIERELRTLVREAIDEAREAGDLRTAEPPAFDVTRPARREHGDWSANVAMVLAKAEGKAPREIAEAVVRHLPAREWVRSVEVAGPGFVNFHLTGAWLHDTCQRVLALGLRFGSTEEGQGAPVNVEFVSINPTGPLLVSHGRNAALGDAIARLLDFTGWKVTREYYLNDAGNQMRLFLQSVAARYKELVGADVAFPDDGYQGGYVYELAQQLVDADGKAHADLSLDGLAEVVRERVYPTVLGWIRDVLERMRVSFDVWTSERTELREAGIVDQLLAKLRKEGLVYEHEGAVWLRTTDRGDGRDRPVVTSDGRPTYLLADLAYHLQKVERGFSLNIDVWGADHHGQVASLYAGLEMLGVPRDRLEIVIYQWVHLVRGGEAVGMSKRLGSGVALDELIAEVGVDAARYTFLQSGADQTLNFDIEEVTKQSLENPVYYVQYAHARIASILRHAADQGVASDGEVVWDELHHEAEEELMRAISGFEETVVVAAHQRAPYRVAKFAEELARHFHRFYTECRVVTEDEKLTRARLAVATAAKQVLANALGLLGVSAPERMERADEGEAG